MIRSVVSSRELRMHQILLLGAGKIGSAIAKLLAGAGDYNVCVGDSDAAALKRLEDAADVKTVHLDVSKEAELRKVMQGRDSVVSACCYNVNAGIAQAALGTGASYFDLTEDVGTAHLIRKLAASAKPGQIFM